MARPREFDVDEVLAKAMIVFWEYGYHSCSLEDLVNATGLNKQSIYGAFGDKHSVLLKALELYRKDNLNAIGAMLEAKGAPLQVLHKFFSYACDPSQHPNLPSGCLVTNIALEFGTSDAEISKEVRNMLTGMQRLFTGVIEKGQSTNAITTKIEASVLALCLVNTLSGIRVLQKAGTPYASIEQIWRNALKSLES